MINQQKTALLGRLGQAPRDRSASAGNYMANAGAIMGQQRQVRMEEEKTPGGGLMSGAGMAVGGAYAGTTLAAGSAAAAESAALAAGATASAAAAEGAAVGSAGGWWGAAAGAIIGALGYYLS